VRRPQATRIQGLTAELPQRMAAPGPDRQMDRRQTCRVCRTNVGARPATRRGIKPMRCKRLRRYGSMCRFCRVSTPRWGDCPFGQESQTTRDTSSGRWRKCRLKHSRQRHHPTKPTLPLARRNDRVRLTLRDCQMPGTATRQNRRTRQMTAGGCRTSGTACTAGGSSRDAADKWRGRLPDRVGLGRRGRKNQVTGWGSEKQGQAGRSRYTWGKMKQPPRGRKTCCPAMEHSTT
jgi:hypothetical protein